MFRRVWFESSAAPFAASSPIATIVAHVKDPLPPPRSINPALPPQVEVVLTRALAKDPRERYSSAGELARVFADALRGTGELIPPSGTFDGAAVQDATPITRAVDPVPPEPVAAPAPGSSQSTTPRSSAAGTPLTQSTATAAISKTADTAAAATVLSLWIWPKI